MAQALVTSPRPMSTKNDWLFMVYIEAFDRKCCGSIVSDKWVLSAGTCFHGHTSDIEMIRVYADLAMIDNDIDESTRMIALPINHPSYNPSFAVNDISLIHFVSTIPDKKTFAQIPFSSKQTILGTDRVCDLAAWLTFTPESRFVKIYRNRVRILDNSECYPLLAALRKRQDPNLEVQIESPLIYESRLCGQFLHKLPRNVFIHLIGAPVICNEELIAMFSNFINDTDSLATNDTYLVLTNIAFFNKWINETKSAAGFLNCQMLIVLLSFVLINCTTLE